MKTAIRLLAGLAILLIASTASAQPPRTLVRVLVAPENTDWTYKPGEKLKFNVSVFKNDIPLQDVEIRYEISEDMMPAHDQGTMALKKGSGIIDAGTLRKPGFLRCRVWVKYDGRDYDGYATAAFDADKIIPTVQNPDDFDRFWADAKAELARVPIDPILTLIPERCTPTVDVYHLGIRTSGQHTRVYGILCVPKAAGKYPAILRVPGAGIRPYYGDVHTAERGYITLQIGIHGIPVNLPQGIYNDLERGALMNYPWIKLDDRDNYYYKRVYLGCVRALDYLCSSPQWDGKNLLVEGGSQGGALAIVTAGLDDRVTGIASFYPAT